jgi:hypothetical protein
VAEREAVTWPGLPRLLADLGRVRDAVEDTTTPDEAAAGIFRTGLSAYAPVRTGFLAGSSYTSGPDVLMASYWSYVDGGSVRMEAHPFVSQGLSAVLSGAEDVYAEHLRDAFAPVTGSRY